MKRAIVLERRTAVLQHRGQLFLVFIRLIGIEPTHPAPEAGALSTELQAHMLSYETFTIIAQFHERMQGNFKILPERPKSSCHYTDNGECSNHLQQQFS